MKNRTLLSAAAAFAAVNLTPAAALAQDSGDEEVVMTDGASSADSPMSEAEEMEQAMAMVSALFPVEPLTADQEARLPQATRIVGTMIPEGALGEMMGSTFDKILEPMMEMAGGPPTAVINEGTGLTAFDLDLTEEQAAEIAAIFDPVWEERREREMAMFPEMMTSVMEAMEPGMRKAMSELYAINFNQTELDEIEAFFATDTGASFARKSFTMSSDPRIISASMEAMPAMMGSFAELEVKLQQATADLPSKKTFADLTPDQQARVSETVGYTVAEIEAIMADGETEWDDAAEEAVEEGSAEDTGGASSS